MEDKKTEQRILQHLGNLVDAYEFIHEELVELPNPSAGLNRRLSVRESLAEDIILVSNREGREVNITYVHSDGKRRYIKINVEKD